MKIKLSKDIRHVLSSQEGARLFEKARREADSKGRAFFAFDGKKYRLRRLGVDSPSAGRTAA